jgi:hypothetical protein
MYLEKISKLTKFNYKTKDTKEPVAWPVEGERGETCDHSSDRHGHARLRPLHPWTSGDSRAEGWGLRTSRRSGPGATDTVHTIGQPVVASLQPKATNPCSMGNPRPPFQNQSNRRSVARSAGDPGNGALDPQSHCSRSGGSGRGTLWEQTN